MASKEETNDNIAKLREKIFRILNYNEERGYNPAKHPWFTQKEGQDDKAGKGKG